ncbi:MAG: hypothetical protein WC791_04260 [Candidatus Paceibacterota bacterium]|jgi:hypothetical protein
MKQTSVPSRTTYRHLHDTLLRRVVEETSYFNHELKTVYSNLRDEVEATILDLGPCHMDDEVLQHLHVRFKEFVSSIKKQNPDVVISVYPN